MSGIRTKKQHAHLKWIIDIITMYKQYTVSILYIIIQYNMCNVIKLYYNIYIYILYIKSATPRLNIITSCRVSHPVPGSSVWVLHEKYPFPHCSWSHPKLTQVKELRNAENRVPEQPLAQWLTQTLTQLLTQPLTQLLTQPLTQPML